MIDLAIEVAVRAHQNQVRKGTDIPYITHPLAVSIILAKAGCSDDVIIAGILHDTVEDTSITLGDLRDTFGDKVSRIVEGASEPDKSLPWEERKRHTQDFLKGASPKVKFVALADKLNNIRAIAADYREIGEGLWKRFNRGKEAQKWYYQDMILELIQEHGPVSRKDIDNLLMDKLPEILTEKQKKDRIHNLLAELSGGLRKVKNIGTRRYSKWALFNDKKTNEQRP